MSKQIISGLETAARPSSYSSITVLQESESLTRSLRQRASSLPLRIAMNHQDHPTKSSTTCEPPAWYADADQVEITTLLRNLKQDLSLNGIISLGTDGVLRSLTWDRRVVDAVGLSRAQITSFLRRIPGELGNPEPFSGADGTKVPREEWFNPDPKLLPAPLREEKRDQTLRAIEADPDKYRDRIARLKEAWDRAGQASE